MWIKLLWIVLVIWGGLSVGAAGELTGKNIIEEQQNRHIIDHEFSQVNLTLVDRMGKEKHQKLVIYAVKKEGKTKTLIQYHTPAKLHGVGLLTWEQGKDKEDDQWLYLSASRSTKRIAGGSKKNQFMGTDLAFEDMRPENLDAHEYTLVGEENIFNHKCWKIQAIPATEKEKKISGYGKRIMWVDQSNYFTLKVDFYDLHDRHIKTAVFENVRNLSGQVFRSYTARWQRIRQKTTTIVTYEKIDITTSHKDIIFTKNYMKRPIK